MVDDLERRYQDAQSALRARDYDRASDLLRQILFLDDNYKDASRLLAQSVRLKRRRWYNDPRLWGASCVIVLFGIGVLVAPHLQGLYGDDAAPPTISATTASSSVPTSVATSTATPIPLIWKRISVGQEFARDMVTAITMDPKDPEVLYAGMKNSGIYKSIDGGISWRPAHHGLASARVASLLIDSQNPRILYAGTIAGVFRTEDGGENWLKVGSGISLVMDPQNSSHLYARDVDHIYESNDQGISWESVYSAKGNCPGAILSMAIHPTNGRTLFVGGEGGCEPGVYLSDDGGRTWRLLWKEITDAGLDAFTLGLDQLAVGLDRQGAYSIQGVAAFDSNGSVYSYCDAHLCKEIGDEHQTVKLGKPDVGVFASIKVSPHDSGTIYVGGTGMSVSKDGGVTWEKLNNGLGAALLTLETGPGSRSALYLQVDECNERVRTHTSRSNRKPEPGQELYISNNGGQTWDLALQTGCYLIKDANGLTLYRAGQSYEFFEGSTDWTVWIWRSQDGGKSWKKVTIPTFAGTLTADIFQSGLLYVENGGGTGSAYDQYVSEDYGNKWKARDPSESVRPCYGSTLHFIDKYRPMTIDHQDGNHVFVIDERTLLESQDSCDTTVPFASAPKAAMNAIAFDPKDSATIYAGADTGSYLSFDSGKTWTQINDGLLGATVVYSIAVDNDSNVFAATPYGVFKLEKK